MAVNLTGYTQITNGTIRNEEINSNANISYSKLAQRTLQKYAVPLTTGRVWNAVTSFLPSTSSSDDLGLYGGTWATNSAAIKTYDVKTVGATNLYAFFEVTLPPEYEAGETVQLRAHCDMSAVADTTCTLDMVCYRSDQNAGIGSDLVTTSATDINTLTEDDYDFALDASTLTPGDTLNLRLNVAPNDAAGASPVIVTIGALWLMCDTRG